MNRRTFFHAAGAVLAGLATGSTTTACNWRRRRYTRSGVGCEVNSEQLVDVHKEQLVDVHKEKFTDVTYFVIVNETGNRDLRSRELFIECNTGLGPVSPRESLEVARNYYRVLGQYYYQSIDIEVSLVQGSQSIGRFRISSPQSRTTISTKYREQDDIVELYYSSSGRQLKFGEMSRSQWQSRS